MARLSRAAARVDISDEAAAHITEELRRVLTAMGRDEPPGTQSHRCEVARSNVRARLNRCPETLVMLLRQNGRAKELAAVIEQLAPMDALAGDITDIARHVTAMTRELGEPIEDLLMGRASTEDLATVREVADKLEDECEQLSDAAAHHQYASMRRMA